MQAGGHRFDPDSLHQWLLSTEKSLCSNGWSDPETAGLALCSFGVYLDGLYGGDRVRAVGLSIVNQVLVRLWACCGQPSLTGCPWGNLRLQDRGEYVQRCEKAE